MSRELMSLQMVQPMILPDELTTTASSGSGTFHFESLRMRTSWRGPEDLDPDRGRRRRDLLGDQDAGAECAALVVDLGLREIEGVLAFDVARAHVVADRPADDAAGGVDDDRELGLRDVPLRVLADARAKVEIGGKIKKSISRPSLPWSSCAPLQWASCLAAKKPWMRQTGTAA